LHLVGILFPHNNNVLYLSLLKEEQEIFMQNHRHFHSAGTMPCAIRTVNLFNIQDCGLKEVSR